ncbi:MAG: hypothetical protein ACM34I_03025 [bacterium]
METLKLERIRDDVREIVRPFLEDVLKSDSSIHSIHIVGSVLTEDFVKGTSDINSVILINTMNFSFLDHISALGKKYGRKRIAAPLVITPEYMNDSLDTFPIEFLNFKLIHQTVYGPDVFSGIEIKKHELRLQCEREIKSKLLWLRQSYVSSAGDRKLLLERMVRSLTGFLPLFRAISSLKGRNPQINGIDEVRDIVSCCSLKTNAFEKILRVKQGVHKPSTAEMPALFEEYYHATEEIAQLINDLAV